MFRKRFVCLLAVLALVLGFPGAALALEVDCDTVYCFTQEDFSEEEPLAGICVMGLPDARAGTVMLGQRTVREGDILTAGQLAQMTFVPLDRESDLDAEVSYLPIYENRVEQATSRIITVRGKENKPPVAEDMCLETYKNMPNEAALPATDPEGQALTFTLIRQPRRGTVELREDGTFLYTPKKNKVGVDSFTYTAADPAGKVSREATVTVKILKPTQAEQYTDTGNLDCRFEAEWLRSTGLFVGEQMGGAQCFQPDKSVTRGQFLAMLTRLLELDVEEQASYTGLADTAPAWLKPYLAAAVRSGLAANWRLLQEQEPDPDAPITGAEAALMLQNALDLTVSAPVERENAEDQAVWEETALLALEENGILLDGEAVLTRGDTAQLLYQVSRLAAQAPGLAVFRVDQ